MAAAAAAAAAGDMEGRAAGERGEQPSHSPPSCVVVTAATELLFHRRMVWLGGSTCAVALVFVLVVSLARHKSYRVAGGGGGPAVTGSFRLDYDAGFVEKACNMIETQFVASTECICSLDWQHPSSVNYGCRHLSKSCSETTCGVPTYTGAVSLEAPVAASSYCLNSLFVGSNRVGTLCLSIPNHEHAAGALESCKASLNGRMCTKCEVCDGGTGIQLDCSRHGTWIKSTNCDALGLISAIKGETSAIMDFFPSFRIEDP